MKKRLFIAVDISDEARRLAEEYVDELRTLAPDARVGWTKAENLHLTLRFLGDVDESKVNDLIEALERTAKTLPAVETKIEGTGVFPSARRPKVLWLGITDTSGCLAGAALTIEKETAELGFDREDREFSPHLTIGRVREPRNGRAVAAIHLQHGFGSVVFTVNEITLYESKLSPKGSIYTPVVKAKLSG